MARYGKRPAARSAEVTNEEELHLKTRFEKLLCEARQEFLDSGEPMLDWDGVEREIARRRGGAGDED
jgi:hypothetical protein